MKVINLFGGPGVGKSTMASGLFYILKKNGHNVEYVTEQAKSFTWENRHTTLMCQPYVFAKQMRNIWRLNGKVDYVICDSPLLLSYIYADHSVWPKEFFDYVFAQFNAFDNINFLLERNKKYVPIGRNEDESEAKLIDLEIESMLKEYSIEYYNCKDLPNLLYLLATNRIVYV